MTDGPEGITFLDHTADVGMEVVAPTQDRLFHNAAMGMMALLDGRDDTAAGQGVGLGDEASSPQLRDMEMVRVGGEAQDPAALLAHWLKELLFLHEVRHRDYARADMFSLTETALDAWVETVPAAPAVREIKGVTYHELSAVRTEDGWTATVIFDV